MGSEESEGRDQLGSKYLLSDPIGRGAMGVVYDATTTENQVVAVKVLRPELSSDPKTVSRFIQERDIFRRIDHPNVVRVYDLVVEGDRLGIVMEKVSGGDLRTKIESRTLDPTQSVGIALAIADGLSAIHSANVIHRDLKPANILLIDDNTGNLTPKISDFGVSRLVSEAMTRTSSTIGTPLYMAPESADQRGAGPASDVYALGAILFEMLTGMPPFHQGGTFAVLRAHAETPPPRVEGVPEQLADLIDGMLAKEPEARPGLVTISQTLGGVLAAPGHPMAPTIGTPPTSGPSSAPAAPAESAESAGKSASTAETMVSGIAFVPGPDAPPPNQPTPYQEWPAPAGPALAGSAPGSEPVLAPGPPTPAPAAAVPAVGLENGSPPFTANRATITNHGLDRVSRRTIEIGAVLASLAAVALLTFVLVNRGENSSSTTGDETVAGEDPASPQSDEDGAVSDGDGGDGDSASGQFDEDSGDGSEAEGANRGSDDGDAGQDGGDSSDGNNNSDNDSNGDSGNSDDSDGDGDNPGGGQGEEGTTTTAGDEPTTTTEAPTTTEGPTTTEEITTTTEEVTTTTEEELEPLTLTGFRAINITETSVRIVWQSSHCAISQITLNGDTTTDTGWPRASSPCWTSHGRNYTNLQPGKTYTVSVKVADQQGRLANAGPITFTTTG